MGSHGVPITTHGLGPPSLFSGRPGLASVSPVRVVSMIRALENPMLQTRSVCFLQCRKRSLTMFSWMILMRDEASVAVGKGHVGFVSWSYSLTMILSCLKNLLLSSSLKSSYCFLKSLTNDDTMLLEESAASVVVDFLWYMIYYSGFFFVVRCRVLLVRWPPILGLCLVW